MIEQTQTAAPAQETTAAATASKASFFKRAVAYIKKNDAKILFGATAIISGGLALSSGVGILAAIGIAAVTTVGALVGGTVAGVAGAFVGIIASTIGNIAAVLISSKNSKPAKKSLGEQIFNGASVISTACAIAGMTAGGYVGYNFGNAWFGKEEAKTGIQQVFNNAAAVNAEKTISYETAALNARTSAPSVKSF